MKQTYIHPTGPTTAKIAIVGEQPGTAEIRQGKPFVGPAGQGLNQCLSMAKISRTDCYLTNVIKDLDEPLTKYINLNKSGSYTVSENGYKYIQELGEELSKLPNLNIVVALGNVALIALTNRIGITKWRGSIITSTIVPDLKVIPTFHPATFIPPKFNYLNKPLIVNDLIEAKYQSEFHGVERSTRNIKITPTFSEACDYLNYIYNHGKRGATIDMDIEIVNRELDCIAFAWDPYNAICIPFRDNNGDYFHIEQEYEIMLLIAKIIQDPDISKRGANFIFDTQFMLNKYGMIPRGPIHCTQIAQKIMYPDYPAGLDFVTTMHTDIPYYKADGKQWMKRGIGTWETWWNYNGMDAISTAAAHPEQIAELERQSNIETYERQRKLIHPLIYMAERGIKIDVSGMIKFKEEEQAKLDKLSEDLYREVGYEINYNSPKQLINYFYTEQGIKPYKKRNAQGKYSPTTDVDAMKRLSRRGFKAAQIMLDIRGLSKRISTYLNIKKIDKDGRMRSSYKPVGAETGRLSSGETIFGTGCMPPEAEVLTKSGWKTMLEVYNNPEEIMQWSTDGTLSWCTPIMNSYDFIGDMVESNSSIHKALYTPEHRIPTISKRGFLTVYKSEEVMCKSNWFLPLSGTYNSGTINLPCVELLAIIQADGSIEGNAVRFTFSKKRKIDRFLSIMSSYSIPFTEQSASEGFRRFYIGPDYIKSYINILTSTGLKSFGSWIFHLSQQSLITLLDEIKHWDSYIRGNSFIYYTINKSNAEWVATLAHLCNKSATISKVANNEYEGAYGKKSTLYNVNIKPRNKAYQHKDMYSKRYYNWRVFCPTVDTSYFLCRYDNTIFVTGNSNQQNWPHDLLRFFLFDEGYLGYSLDLSQIENRIVAYVGGVLPQIEAFEKGIDLHRMTASVIFGKPYDEISAEDGSSSLGDGRQSERYWGKKGNHAMNYDVGYKTFALKNEMTEAEAKHTIEKIHRGYPQVRGSYHVTIQNMLKRNRIVTNLFGRNRLFLGPIIPSREEPASACLNTYREAYAHLPQSTTADKVNEQGLEYIYYNQDLFAPVELLAQVHDSVVFQIPLSVPWPEHARIISQIKNSLEQPLYWKTTKIKTPVDVAIGLNMCKDDMIEIKSKDVPDDNYLLALKIEMAYKKLLRLKEKESL